MEIKDVNKITDLNHLNLFSIQYQDMAGNDKKWIFASRSGLGNPLNTKENLPDAVVVVPYHTGEKKLVIVREYRVVLGEYQYGFPAGLVDPGESIEQAGKRELFEETGLKLVRVLRQSPAVYSSSGMTDESVSLLYAECVGTPCADYTEDSEDIETLLLSQDDAKALMATPKIKFDVKTWIVLQTFAIHGMV